jgi:hypothetical protein
VHATLGIAVYAVLLVVADSADYFGADLDDTAIDAPKLLGST